MTPWQNRVTELTRRMADDMTTWSVTALAGFMPGVAWG